MDDRDIISLYVARDEGAIGACEEKYGRYLYALAYNVLGSHEDAKECVNDTYMLAWKSIPPQMPGMLKAFLAKIARNQAINRYHHDQAKKRGGGTIQVMDEFWECILDGGMMPEDEVILRSVLNSFLASLPKKTRIVFLQRYFYMCSVKEIAEKNRMSETNVKVTLLRTREKFRKYLEKEGVMV